MKVQRALWILVALASGGACGGGNDSEAPSDGAFEQRCQVQCAAANDEFCTDDDRASCMQTCRANTSGLDFICGACLIDNGRPLYSLGDDTVGYCDGGYLGDLDDEDCASLCQGGDHDGGSSEIEYRCQVHCDISGDAYCSDDDSDSCLQGCRANTSGLDFICGACLIDSGRPLYSLGDDTVGYCDGGYLGDLGGESNCSAYCR